MNRSLLMLLGYDNPTQNTGFTLFNYIKVVFLGKYFYSCFVVRVVQETICRKGFGLPCQKCFKRRKVCFTVVICKYTDGKEQGISLHKLKKARY